MTEKPEYAVQVRIIKVTKEPSIVRILGRKPDLRIQEIAAATLLLDKVYVKKEYLRVVRTMLPGFEYGGEVP